MIKIITNNNNLIKYLIFITSTILYVFGVCINNHNLSLLAVCIVFLYNIFEAIKQKKIQNAFYVIFMLCIYLFLLSRPTIALLRGIDWSYFNDYTINVSLLILLLSLISLNFGFNSNLVFKLENKCILKLKDKFNFIIHTYPFNNSLLKKILLILLFISFFSSFCKGVLSYLSFKDNFVQIYLGHEIKIPILQIFSGCMNFFLFIYLSLLPTKKESYIILSCYIFCSLPDFLLGSRNAVMIKVLFCFAYFLLREVIEKKNIWIGKNEKRLIVLMIPFFMIILGAMNYTREDKEIPSMNPIEICSDFLYKQGTSFDTLCQTIQYKGILCNETYINYTFGELIDFTIHNKISNMIFGTRSLDNGNSIYNATMSNNLAHRVSYIALGDSYLEGHGRGTTYLSEIYLDFGYLGIIIFNYFIGYYLSKLSILFAKSSIIRIIILNILYQIYIIPRFSFFSLFSFVINYYFYISIIIIMLSMFFIRKIGGNRNA